MRRIPGIATVTILFAAAIVSGRASTESRASSGLLAHRWLRKPIIISLSTSLASPSQNFKANTDVTGALRRALQSWSDAADLQFLETNSTMESISPLSGGDGVNLITISTVNAAVFGSSESPGQTRVFYDSGGAVVEADIALNPSIQFSSDGTPGTYDLESTFAHEIGHLLGLEHSAIIGATMQPRQARNGVYGLPAITARSLSEDDSTRARALYNTKAGMSSISGRLSTNTRGRADSIFGAHIFAEDVASGNVVGGSVSLASGIYRLDGLRAGVYRLFGQSLNGPIAAADIASGTYSGLSETTPSFRSFVASASTPSQSLNISASSAVRLSFFVFSFTPSLKPHLIGMNGELSTAALPLASGKTFTIHVGGEGVDQVPFEGVSISSPSIQVVPDSLRSIDFGTAFPVISFDVTIPPNTQPGDYSIRLQSHSGELAYLPGALAVAPD